MAGDRFWKYSIPKRRDSENAFIPDFLTEPIIVVQVELLFKIYFTISF